jgi:hydrogenase maturation protease
MVTRNTRLQDTLVIGFGNECRGDDALGPEVARRIASRRWPGVRVAVMHQLTPELAEELSLAARAIFVDAHVNGRGPSIVVEPISPDRGDSLATHLGDPRALLALAQILYGRAPQSWLVTIAGERFAPGEPLSETALRRAAEAVQRIETLLNTTNLLEEHR